MPLISVITPVYNCETYLPISIKSVLNQTCKDFEYILVDDCSSDRSVDIIKEAMRIDNRVRILYMEENSGPAAARNRGIENANGRYLAFLDADDYWLPHKLMKITEYMSANNYEIVYHGFRYVNSQSNQSGSVVYGPKILDLKTLHTRRGTGDCSSVTIDTKTISSLKFFEGPRNLHEDFITWMFLIRHGHVGHLLQMDLGRIRISSKSRNYNKINSIKKTWYIYRNISNLSWYTAIYWFAQYLISATWIAIRCRLYSKRN